MTMDAVYDIIILGSGPAGLSAGLYAGRSRMKTLLLEQSAPGGQIAVTAEIENYPGCLDDDSGPSLIARFVKQAERFGVERVSDTVVSAQLVGDLKTIVGQKGTYYGKTVIIATGASPVHIGCPGEEGLIGKGVSFCATCDAAFFEDMEVFVVGGGDAAVEEAMYLTKFARKVTLIHRRDTLRAAKSIQEKAFATEKLSFMWNTVVKELSGSDGILDRMVVEDTVTGQQTEILADEDDGLFGVFVFIGYKPRTAIFDDSLVLENGYIPTDDKMRTNIPGVFAAGDVRVKSLRQVVTAAADGAIAAVEAEHYLESRD